MNNMNFAETVEYYNFTDEEIYGEKEDGHDCGLDEIGEGSCDNPIHYNMKRDFFKELDEILVDLHNLRIQLERVRDELRKKIYGD